jgi:uncharacterized protein (DUF2461 family)
MPPPELLRSVRRAISARPEQFLGIVEGREFRRAFGELEGEQLKTMPKGFSPDHPAARYLRYKQFLFGEEHPAGLATSPKFLLSVLRCFERGMPLIRFLKEPARQAAAESASSNVLLSERALG